MVQSVYKGKEPCLGDLCKDKTFYVGLGSDIYRLISTFLKLGMMCDNIELYNLIPE